MRSVFRENKRTYTKERKPNKQEWLSKVLLALNGFGIMKAIGLSQLTRIKHHPNTSVDYF
jgi:preprotein translocase subunit Sss1